MKLSIYRNTFAENLAQWTAPLYFADKYKDLEEPVKAFTEIYNLNGRIARLLEKIVLKRALKRLDKEAMYSMSNWLNLDSEVDGDILSKYKFNFSGTRANIKRLLNTLK